MYDIDLVITVPADTLAPDYARPSEGAMTTKNHLPITDFACISY